MAKCCNYTDNASPTLAQCQAIETNWNTFVNTFFTEIDDKYPETDLTQIDLNEGTTLLRDPKTLVTEKHATTNRPYYRVFEIDLDPVKIVDEELSAIRLKGHLVDVEDGIIHNNFKIVLNSQRMIVGLVADNIQIEDEKNDVGNPFLDPPVAADPDKVTHKGLNSAIAAGKVILRTHEGHMQYGGYVREELIIDADWKKIPE